jgi:hypothetical protein
MATVFYLLGVFIFLKELGILRNPKKQLKLLRAVDNKGEGGWKSEGDYSTMSDENKSIVRNLVFALFYLSWTIIGCLFSSQWLLFVGFLIFGFAAGFYRRRFYKNNTRKSIQVIKFDALVSSIMLAVIILNHFHHFV